MPSLYETDFYEWTKEMAHAVRDGRRVDEADRLLIAEEIEDLGKSERKSLRSAVVVLFMHLLKKDRQATRSWDLTIKDQRQEIEDILGENPSLRSLLKDAEFIGKAYERARIKAALETGLPEGAFPETCPFDETVFGRSDDTFRF
jgi:hypothetical protein